MGSDEDDEYITLEILRKILEKENEDNEDEIIVIR